MFGKQHIDDSLFVNNHLLQMLIVCGGVQTAYVRALK